MGNVKKLIILLLACLFLEIASYPVCFAANVGSIQIQEKIGVPQELNFSVSDVCSEHTYFMQAAANELGDFAIYTRHVNPKDNSDVDFNRVYIDLYQRDGKLINEISFTTPLDLAIELEGNFVNVYFYNYMLVYDFITQEASCYSIPDGAAISGGLYKQLRSKSFLAGDWTYNCKKSMDGYTKLTRSNTEQVQVLVEMPGTGDFWLSTILVGGGIGIITMLFVLWQFKKR